MFIDVDCKGIGISPLQLSLERVKTLSRDPRSSLFDCVCVQSGGPSAASWISTFLNLVSKRHQCHEGFPIQCLFEGKIEHNWWSLEWYEAIGFYRWVDATIMNVIGCWRLAGWLAGCQSLCLSVSFFLSVFCLSHSLRSVSLSLSVSFCILSIHLSTYLPTYDAVSSGPSQLVWVSPPSKPVGGGRYGCGGGDGGDVIVIICFYHS